jgi:hypothetical protein
MNYYKKIDIDFYDEIVRDTLSYLLNQKPDIYNRDITKAGSFNVLDLEEFKKFCPKLDLGFAKYNLVCNLAVAFVMYNNAQTTIHIDVYKPSHKNKTRINVPILNTKDTFTRFYEGGEFVLYTNPITDITNYTLRGIKGLKLVDKVEIDKPTVVRVDVPHDVKIDLKNVPRITLSLGFDKDPVFLLDELI